MRKPGRSAKVSQRIALDGPDDEVRRLAGAFDLMLARFDRSLDGQRRFVANASQELRPPLALNRALVELAITRDDIGPDTQRLGESLLKVNERHEQLIDGLLTLADSDTELATREAVDLAEVARHVVSTRTGPAIRTTLAAARRAATRAAGADGAEPGRKRSVIHWSGDRYTTDFIAQFGEEVVEANFGDAGTMYVFADTAYYHSH